EDAKKGAMFAFLMTLSPVERAAWDHAMNLYPLLGPAEALQAFAETGEWMSTRPESWLCWDLFASEKQELWKLMEHVAGGVQMDPMFWLVDEGIESIDDLVGCFVTSALQGAAGLLL